MQTNDNINYDFRTYQREFDEQSKLADELSLKSEEGLKHLILASVFVVAALIIGALTHIAVFWVGLAVYAVVLFRSSLATHRFGQAVDKLGEINEKYTSRQKA